VRETERLRDGKYLGAPGRERERGDTGQGRATERELIWPAGSNWRRWWVGTGRPGTGRWRERDRESGMEIGYRRGRGKIFKYALNLARVRASKNDFGTLFNRVFLNILGCFSAKCP
jgi:hypothetical protein